MSLSPSSYTDTLVLIREKRKIQKCKNPLFYYPRLKATLSPRTLTAFLEHKYNVNTHRVITTKSKTIVIDTSKGHKKGIVAIRGTLLGFDCHCLPPKISVIDSPEHAKAHVSWQSSSLTISISKPHCRPTTSSISEYLADIMRPGLEVWVSKIKSDVYLVILKNTLTKHIMCPGCKSMFSSHHDWMNHIIRTIKWIPSSWYSAIWIFGELEYSKKRVPLKHLFEPIRHVCTDTRPSNIDWFLYKSLLDPNHGAQLRHHLTTLLTRSSFSQRLL